MVKLKGVEMAFTFPWDVRLTIYGNLGKLYSLQTLFQQTVLLGNFLI